MFLDSLSFLKKRPSFLQKQLLIVVHTSLLFVHEVILTYEFRQPTETAPTKNVGLVRHIRLGNINGDDGGEGTIFRWRHREFPSNVVFQCLETEQIRNGQRGDGTETGENESEQNFQRHIQGFMHLQLFNGTNVFTFHFRQFEQAFEGCRVFHGLAGGLRVDFHRNRGPTADVFVVGVHRGQSLPTIQHSHSKGG